MTAAAPATGPAIRVDGVSMVFGGLTALDSVSFDIRRGETLSLIGPNGAGKTTLLNVISGTLTPTSGRVEHDPLDIDSHAIVLRLRAAMAHSTASAWM